VAAASVSPFQTLPFAQLRENRHFYLQYDAFYAVLSVLAIALLRASGHVGIYGEGGLVGAFAWSHLAAFPLVVYVIILGHVFSHVCSHQSLPKPWNRIVGELAGIVVLTRFASWEVVHQRHHRHSDDTAKDPHPCMPSYWAHVWHTVVNVERQLQQTYYDVHGDTPENRAYEGKRVWVSYLTNIALLGAWLTLLGPLAFFAFFVPASALAALHLFHFNWSTHDALSPEGDYKPINQDHGFFWLGNRIFFGIYFHANHHKWPNILNPRNVRNPLPVAPAPTREALDGYRRFKASWLAAR
jgi:fatty acid desaturase